ncbi:MAG: GNAT family N-acetyltransferase [Streptococcus suis]
MNNYIIRKAVPSDFEFAFEMLVAAGRGMIERYYGVGSKTTAKTILKFLWSGKPNRQHYKNCYILECDGEPLGLLLSYVVGEDNYSSVNIKEIIKAGGFKIIWHYMTNMSELISSLSLPEGRVGEYYIASVATSEKARGMGIGTELFNFAKRKAKDLNKNQVSLVVEKDNIGAIRLYERLGFYFDDAKNSKHELVHRMILNI